MSPLIALGIMFLAGYIASFLFEKYVPSDLLYVLVGVLLGPILNILPEGLVEGEHTLAFITLGAIALLLSPHLSGKALKNPGKRIIAMSLIESLFTFAVVFLGFCVYFALTGSIQIAPSVLLGSLASLTSPAITLMLMRENETEGPLTTYSAGMLVFDSVWGLIVFVAALGVCRALSDPSALSYASIALTALMEILAPAAIGVLCGLALDWFLRKNSQKEHAKDLTILIVVAILLLVTGIAEDLMVSVLLSAMMMGVVLMNRSPHGSTALSYVDVFMAPLFLIFFVITGANLEIGSIPEMWSVVLVFCALRTFGKIFGTRIGAVLVGAPGVVRDLAGYTMLAQGGTDIGLALMVSLTFPQMSSMLTVVLGAAAIFEIIAPFATKRAILRSGEGAVGERG
jgi:Kef-type K+ transport system membrane component KefB